MRPLLAFAALLLSPLTVAGAQAPRDGERYIPRGLWSDAADERRYEQRLGRLLRAMGEPVLWTDPGPFRRRFRLLVVPDLPGRASMLRIDQRRSGGAEVRTATLEVRVDYSLGPVDDRLMYEIDRDAVLELERALQLSGLSALSPEGPIDLEPVYVSEDEVAIRVCMHPNTFLFEIVERGSSRYVLRDSCNMPPGLWRLLERLRPLRVR